MVETHFIKLALFVISEIVSFSGRTTFSDGANRLEYLFIVITRGVNRRHVNILDMNQDHACEIVTNV